ncbi:hypothetical protein [Streptomyces sp. NBC_00439]|uniref:hypothetical protein n=1 Tax=Streptomyces sp. NBC_00439 TaxID=2903650 RepID=UPI00225553B4|nr:hypothetical protein [Streptomyces sp. NBC_00439]MCX5103441.1 hypothetical protein [Streptomyces sp. NBC_00439]
MLTTPADEFRQAASLLRDRATAAIHEGRTRWFTGHTLGSRSPVVLDDPEQPSVLIETRATRLERVNAYLELLGPATGLAGAEWLDAAAKSYNALVAAAALVWSEQHDADEREAWVAKQTDQHALTFARQILGTGQGPEGLRSTTADCTAALGMTPTEYRAHRHHTAVEQIRAAAQGLLFETGARVLNALDTTPK